MRRLRTRDKNYQCVFPFGAEEDRIPWVDFTRRNDPACPEAREHLMRLLQKKKPRVLCLWTKAPARVVRLYSDAIRGMRKDGVLVLCQVTLNTGYRILEPGIRAEYQELDELINLLGGPQYVRARFDPIIFGYTTLAMFEEHCKRIASYGISRTVVNFYVSKYKDTARCLGKMGIVFNPEPTWEEQDAFLRDIAEIGRSYGVLVAVCAETASWAFRYGLLPACCSDPDWAISLRPELAGIFKKHSSRKGCGCVYSEDWGVYRSQGGWQCPHQCLYCYAK
ncbi:MAG: DUF1848 family protein [Thermacetogeniaceae bacterium]